jgi:hypothetical protein
MNIARRFGVRPATFVALGALVVGLITVERKVAELEARVDELGPRIASASIRADLAQETFPPAPSGATAQNKGALTNKTGDADGEGRMVVEHDGSPFEPLPAPWERRRRWDDAGLRASFG